MTNRVLAIFALAVLAAFVAVIVIFVPELDLAIVAAITVVMAGYDFYRDAFRPDGNRPPSR